MTFGRPEKNNLRTRDRASRKSARIVQISEPIAPKSEQGAPLTAPRSRTERQIANDPKRRDQTQAANPAYLKASNADVPSAERGETISTTRTLNAVSLTQTLVIRTWAKPQQRKRSPRALAQEARITHHPKEQTSPPRLGTMTKREMQLGSLHLSTTGVMRTKCSRTLPVASLP